jgi:quinoprotein glucose dehydrogenase
MPLNNERPRGAATWLARILGAVLVLIGVVLIVGGAWLVALHGSPYYLLAGLGLIASGALMILRRITGVWIYAGVFGLTLIWALWEVGLNGWALVPRLVGPLVLLWLALACAPLLTVERSERKLAGALFAGSLAVLVVGVVAVAIASSPAKPGDPGAPLSFAAADAAGADWTAYGGTYGAQRYSTLAQITPENAGKLQRAWSIHTGDLPDTAQARKQYGAETTPLKVGDSLYICTPKNILIALDAATASSAGASIPRCRTSTFRTRRPAGACRTTSSPAPPASAPRGSSRARWTAA